MKSPATPPESPSRPWWGGVTRAQWVVLAIASAGWIFDSYAGQIFNVTRSGMMPEILHLGAGDPAVKFWGEVFLGISLVGGAIGGTYFGSLADRIGRQPAMIITIVIYTVFCGLTGLVHAAWQIAACRFAVAVGTAGAWAVGASLVAEVFSPQRRAQAGAVFHSMSNVGTWLASLAGMAVGLNWRLAYLIGAIPIVLVFWVRSGATESQSWKEQAKDAAITGRRGSFRELLLVKPWGPRAILGMLLAATGIATYWCIAVGGQDMVQEFLIRHGQRPALALSRAQFAYGFLINGGGFVGALAFGPIAEWLGRRRAFACAMLGGVLIVPATCYLPHTAIQLFAMLPLYGFLTFGFHSGFAFYFPELFPTHLRGTGAGFCFNCGRPLAAGVLALSGWIKSRPGMDLRAALSMLALLYLLGLIWVLFLPETKSERLSDMP